MPLEQNKHARSPSAGIDDHIPHILHVIPGFATGGVQIRITYLMNHFVGLAKHSLVATNGEVSCQSRIAAAVDFETLTAPSIAGASLFGRLRRYRTLIRALRPDLLLTYQWGSIEWAMAHSFGRVCRHVHLESGFGPDEAVRTLPRRDLFRRLALRNVHGVVVPSMNLVGICQKNWRLPADKVHYIPNGVDCDKYAAAPTPGVIPNFTKSDSDFVIGTMTPLRPEKNLPRLIRAFHDVATRHPDRSLRLLIMGEGPERAHLEPLAEKGPPNSKVYIPGHIEEPAMALGWLDVYALSSDTEQMPNSVNQAMAAGLAVVGTDVGDVRHIVSDANKRYIVPANNEAEFASALESFLVDPALRQAIGAQNHRHVRNTYDQSRMFDAYAKIWGVKPP